MPIPHHQLPEASTEAPSGTTLEPASERPSEGPTPARSNRIHAILLALQDRQWQRAADMADLFAVSTRTIYRDMQAIHEAGVPVQAVPGKGYRLGDDYFLPPLHFTTDEAILLRLGADHLARHFDAAHQPAARSAALKLSAALPADLRAEADTLGERLRFVPVNAFDDPALQAVLAPLRRALAEQQTTTLTLADGTSRRFDPYSLLHQGTSWQLVGFDHATGRVRYHDVGTLQDVTVSTDPFTRPAGYRADPAQAEPRSLSVRVRFDATVAPWVEQWPAFFVEDADRHDGALVLTLRVRREAEVLPWLLSWGSHARVLEPASLQRRLAHEAARIAAHYQPPPTLLF